MDATFDDAFTAGFWFGRYGLAVDWRYAEKRWSAVCRREYERGVSEGRAFQLDSDAAAAGCGTV